MFKENESALDIWSIPHFLSGVLIGIPALSLGYSLYESLAVVVILSLLFEGVEIFFLCSESLSNKIMDLVLGVMAFILGYLVFSELPSLVNLVMIFSLCTYLLVIVPGWKRELIRQRKHSPR